MPNKRIRNRRANYAHQITRPMCLNCGERAAHYVRPSIGEDGFYICKKTTPPDFKQFTERVLDNCYHSMNQPFKANKSQRMKFIMADTPHLSAAYDHLIEVSNVTVAEQIHNGELLISIPWKPNKTLTTHLQTVTAAEEIKKGEMVYIDAHGHATKSNH